MSAPPLQLQSLPLFPLQAVLFPSGLLALRVFEVRYLDMVRKCHAAQAPFGVVSLQKGDEVQRPGAPAEQLARVGTLAAILGADQPQPGLLLLRCQGQQRFRITAQRRLPHGLWVADVAAIDADAPLPIPPDLHHTAHALRQALTRLHRQQPPGTVPAPDDWQLADCGWVANRWCELLPLPVRLKQQLLELESPLVRLELVGDFLHKTGIG